MGVPALHGRVFTASDARDDVAVLGWRFWQREFAGETSAIGQKLTLNGKARTVLGVMPKRFMWRGADVYIPISLPEGAKAENVVYVHATGRLKPGVTEAQAEGDLTPILLDLKKAEPGAFPDNLRAGILSFANTFPSGLGDVLLMLFGSVGLLLLIACANVSNLLLAQAAARSREMAVRASLGAGRARLIRQLLGESLAIAIVGGLAGVLLAWIGLQGIMALVPEFTIPDEAEVRLNVPVLAFAAAATCLAAIVFGLAPAFAASRRDLVEPLKQASRGAAGMVKRQSLFSSGLVIAEVALSLVMLAGAGLMVRGMLETNSIDYGVRTADLPAARVPLHPTRYASAERRIQFQTQLIENLRAMPEVKEAALGASVHPFGDWGAPVVVNGVEDKRRTMVHAVSHDYTAVMGIRLRQGRELQAADVQGRRRVAVVSEEFARRYFPSGNAIGAVFRVPRVKGRPFSLSEDSFEIVGISSDTSAAWQSSREAEAFVPFTLSGTAEGVMVRPRNGGDPRNLARTVRDAVRALDKDQPVMDPEVLDSMPARYVKAGPRFNVVLFGVFGAIGLLPAVTGLYGVLAHAVARRVPEIGLRMALGASLGDVLGLVMRRGIGLLLSGLVAGSLLSVAAAKALAANFRSVGALDWRESAAAAAVLLFTGAIAVLLPALRAAKVDPVVALRND